MEDKIQNIRVNPDLCFMYKLVSLLSVKCCNVATIYTFLITQGSMNVVITIVALKLVAIKYCH